MVKRRGRPRTWLTEKEFFIISKLLIPKPPKCICGNREYLFKFYHDDVLARCRNNDCRQMYNYNLNRDKWFFKMFR